MATIKSEAVNPFMAYPLKGGPVGHRNSRSSRHTFGSSGCNRMAICLLKFATTYSTEGRSYVRRLKELQILANFPGF